MNNDSFNPDIDNRLIEYPLPYAVWAKNGIKGHNCNGESYLLELINQSSFFQQKSKGKEFNHPEREDDGQCDAITEDYKIDFKNLISSSMARAKSNTEFQIQQVSKGVFYTVSPKDVSDKKYLGAYLLKALRKYSYEDIKNERYLKEDTIVVNDINAMIKWLDKKKNLLIFIPSKFYFIEQMCSTEKQRILREALQYDAYKLFELRKDIQPHYETYLCAILEDDFIIFCDDGEQLLIADIVNEMKCPSYCHLVSLL